MLIKTVTKLYSYFSNKENELVEETTYYFIGIPFRRDITIHEHASEKSILLKTKIKEPTQ